MLKPGAYIMLSHRIFQEDGQFVSVCDDLGLSSCGKTFDEAQDHLASAISLVLNAAEQRGETAKLLAERQIPIHNQGETPFRRFDDISLRPHEWLSSSMLQVGDAGLAAV